MKCESSYSRYFALSNPKSERINFCRERERKRFKRNDICQKTDLLLNYKQMCEEGVPLPPANGRYVPGFVFTKESYQPVTNDSPLYAIDCEMCLTIAHENELTSVSVLDEDLNVVLHSLVLPRNRIINYLTQYSGN